MACLKFLAEAAGTGFVAADLDSGGGIIRIALLRLHESGAAAAPPERRARAGPGAIDSFSPVLGLRCRQMPFFRRMAAPRRLLETTSTAYNLGGDVLARRVISPRELEARILITRSAGRAGPCAPPPTCSQMGSSVTNVSRQAGRGLCSRTCFSNIGIRRRVLLEAPKWASGASRHPVAHFSQPAWPLAAHHRRGNRIEADFCILFCRPTDIPLLRIGTAGIGRVTNILDEV